jgi:hypothetical protein
MSIGTGSDSKPTARVERSQKLKDIRISNMDEFGADAGQTKQPSLRKKSVY